MDNGHCASRRKKILGQPFWFHLLFFVNEKIIKNLGEIGNVAVVKNRDFSNFPHHILPLQMHASNAAHVNNP